METVFVLLRDHKPEPFAVVIQMWSDVLCSDAPAWAGGFGYRTIKSVSCRSAFKMLWKIIRYNI